MNRFSNRLGGQLGVGLAVVGFLLVFLGWNGAASRNFLPSQFPYLISGGITGLCLVIVGVGLIVVQNQRADRAALQQTLNRLIEAVERSGASADPRNGAGGSRRAVGDGMVLAGGASFHRPDCRLVGARDEAQEIDPREAVSRGLTPCRVCQPPTPPAPATPVDDASFAPE